MTTQTPATPAPTLVGVAGPCERGLHRWEPRPWDAAGFHLCADCGEPGFEVPA